MRKIAFRAWDPLEKEMLFVTFKDLLSGCHPGSYISGVDRARYIWMQYTGLKDKNGVEIYEGDIVLVDGRKYKVEWRGAGDWFIDLVDDECFMFTPEVYELEVLGNIHQHPNLLKEVA